MTLPTNLFIDAPEIDDLSMSTLSTNSDEWPEQIIAKLKERVPQSGTASLSVKFMKKDDEVGVATGSVTILIGDKVGVVPVIIKDFRMHPLDVFFAEEKVLPLTIDYFSRYFFSGENESSFSSLEEFPSMSVYSRFSRGESLYNTIYPPVWGRYGYAGAGAKEEDYDEAYPILSTILPTITKEAQEQLLEKVKTEDAVVARLHNNGHLALITKIAGLQPVNMREFRRSADSITMRTTHVLKKHHNNRYSILSNEPHQFNPAFSQADRLECVRFLSHVCSNPQEMMHDLDTNGEKVIFPRELEGTAFLAIPEADQPEVADRFGLYNVRTETGINQEGIVIPKVINLDQQFTGDMLFIGKDKFALQPQIAGHKIKNRMWLPEGCLPKVGQTGTFAMFDGETEGIALEPVTIKLVYHEEHAHDLVLKVITLSGEEVGIVVRKGEKGELEIPSILPLLGEGTYTHGGHLSKKQKRYSIPSNLNWIPLKEMEHLSSTPESYAYKTAATKLTGNPLKLISTGGDEFILRGAEKYANEAAGIDPTRLQSNEAKFLLACLGANEDLINDGIKVAKEKGFVDIHNLNYIPLPSERLKKYAQRAHDLINDAASIKTDAIKEASYMENSQTVDALLSLNFVNADNIAHFIAKIPALKAAVSHLASCLIAARLGMREIPLESAVSAIGKLNDVVTGLEVLRAVNSKKAKK